MIGRVQSVGDWMHQMIGCRLGSEDSVRSDQSITFESSFYPSSVFAPVPPSATSLPPPHTSFVSKIHTFHQTFDEFVCSIGFQVSVFDPCLYVKIVDGHCVLVLVYVDDVLITGSSPELIARTKTDLKTRFEMTDSGKCAFVLGIELVDGPDGSVTMCQRRYVDDILKRFGMDECKAVRPR
ncbi:hypothetical protein PC118_g25693 [Phytophthora cactorum]|uniref:Reverse transcriptase Ty1/copia-type domain-containing protein n=1 Tax=Phytophthora cactorum TaxID=29920 RepID=A0A8T1E1U5_9STRA|nr:hypothetical protein PC118_g25693 [Phytophthora cactorum]